MSQSDEGRADATSRDLINRYLARLELTHPPPSTVDGLAQLMQAHLTAVPFENLDVYWQEPVATDTAHSLTKILDRGRGGWCFELNSAFGLLLSALGYEVRLLGAAVLLSGPSKVVSHLTLEVIVESQPHLVDVGFGDTFARPLPLNGKPDRPIDGFTGSFGFIPSAEGTTLVQYPLTGASPEPQYRFRRVSLTLADFVSASDALYSNPDSHFREGPVATRLIDGGPDRVTLSADRLRFVGPAGVQDQAVEPNSNEWFDHLDQLFEIGPANLPPGAGHHRR